MLNKLSRLLHSSAIHFDLSQLLVQISARQKRIKHQILKKNDLTDSVPNTKISKELAIVSCQILSDVLTEITFPHFIFFVGPVKKSDTQNDSSTNTDRSTSTTNKSQQVQPLTQLILALDIEQWEALVEVFHIEKPMV